MKYLITCFVLFASFSIVAQDQSEKILIFKGTESFSAESLLSELSDYRENQLSLRQIYSLQNLFALNCGSDTEVFSSIKSTLLAQREIVWVEQDIPVDIRNTPSDIDFDQQWYLQKINALDSWNITQGGLTPKGDTIVVAVLDDGFYASHVDLVENLWYNHAEIPGDSVDNDSNGYIDDFKGINMKSKNDMHTVREHGTSVAGIIGAKGNNEIGIAGVNWNIKLLLISEANSLANIIEAYQYVLDMRKLYNESNGEEGAYIVVTNFSAGIDTVFPDDNPIFLEWCQIYNDLGSEGVLSVNATPNSNINIDIEGDIPGTCDSEYLIVVTNSDQNDSKVVDAGFGESHVDLAAPGQQIYSTDLNNEYDRFDGTSSAAPQVAGAVALLYSAPCTTFGNLALDDPEAMARSAKAMLMEGVDNISSLNGKVKSGGRLNIYNAMAEMRDFCEGSIGELTIESLYPNPAQNTFSLHYETENYERHRIDIYNAIGQLIFSNEFNPPFFGKKKLDIDLSYLSFQTGVYIVSIKNVKNVVSKKIILY